MKLLLSQGGENYDLSNLKQCKFTNVSFFSIFYLTGPDKQMKMPPLPFLFLLLPLLLLAMALASPSPPLKTETRWRGSYKVHEEVMAAPTRMHKCEPVNTTVQISFPGMDAEVGVSLLGYREPRLVNVMRCQGRCSQEVSCVASSTGRRTITMLLTTSHTGAEARTERQEVVLEEHLGCTCNCKEEEEQECSGR